MLPRLKPPLLSHLLRLLLKLRLLPLQLPPYPLLKFLLLSRRLPLRLLLLPRLKLRLLPLLLPPLLRLKLQRQQLR